MRPFKTHKVLETVLNPVSGLYKTKYGVIQDLGRSGHKFTVTVIIGDTLEPIRLLGDIRGQGIRPYTPIIIMG